MGIGSFLRCTIAFFTGLYLGYQYHKAVNMYDQGLQKVRQPYFSVYNDDGHNNDDHNNDDQSDSSPSSSDNHSEPEFIGRNLTSPGREVSITNRWRYVVFLNMYFIELNRKRRLGKLRIF
jgi:hypothetical protein